MYIKQKGEAVAISVRMLVFDLDGTTITEHKYLSQENREALIRAGELGVFLVPATGRMRRFLPEKITALAGVRYAITCNGAVVYDLLEDRPIYERLIPNGIARKVRQILDPYDVYLEYYRDGGAITKLGFPEKMVSHFGFPASKWHFVRGKEYAFVEDFGAMLAETGLCPEKINLPYLPGSLREEIWRKLETVDGLRLTSSIPDNLEINAAGADKGSALLYLAERLGVSREEIMALGDNGNDLTMLKTAGISVAVADASQEALAAAAYRTAAHNENGVAQAVRRFILNQG